MSKNLPGSYGWAKDRAKKAAEEADKKPWCWSCKSTNLNLAGDDGMVCEDCGEPQEEK